jgi:hypothetical protein
MMRKGEFIPPLKFATTFVSTLRSTNPKDFIKRYKEAVSRSDEANQS